MRKPVIIALLGAFAAALGGAGYGVYMIGMDRGMEMVAAPANPAGHDAVKEGRRVLYWHDPMNPTVKFDKPGKSPFMDMELQPVYAEDESSGGVKIDPRVRQNLGVRVAEVVMARIGAPLEAVGSVAYNERDVALVQARGNGFLEKLHVKAPLEAVRAGQPLADLYVPDWVAAQEEYLAVKRMAGAPAGLLDAARARMRLAGMSDAQVAAAERDGKPQARVTLTAPIAGIVTELTAREGMTVANGAPLFRINGVATVWINAEVPEAMVPHVRPGARIRASTPAFPGEVFAGTVAAILPEVSTTTRTLKARIEVANPGGRLSPGMFARIEFAAAPAPEVLVVPAESLIRTGTRDVVMVARDDGTFAPVAVEVGAEGEGRAEIRKGLKAGDKVVVSGQFLLDSEANLKGVEARQAR
jgi:Cu(I)/Ag(I) efflux system membrane fusion protein